jgi:D-glycero-beta-D-manno-heptose 1-phosphate adenylyltransferase
LTTPLLFLNKIHPASGVDNAPSAGLLAAVAALPKPVVFTNGVFDLLHRGHVTLLAQARAQGASLVLALNDDASVRRLNKGADRPINALEDRMAVASALGCVDVVTGFSDDTPLALILAMRPDVLVKGGDWGLEDIVGGAEVRSWGGRVLSIAFEHERSTTETLARIRNAR